METLAKRRKSLVCTAARFSASCENRRWIEVSGDAHCHSGMFMQLSINQGNPSRWAALTASNVFDIFSASWCSSARLTGS
jgi:hypothetical protein